MIAICMLAFILINAITVFRFWDDKRRAVRGRRRFSEASLLFLATIGGSPGALLARKLFRHKTRKQPFSAYLLLIVAIQASTISGFFFVREGGYRGYLTEFAALYTKNLHETFGLPLISIQYGPWSSEGIPYGTLGPGVRFPAWTPGLRSIRLP